MYRTADRIAASVAVILAVGLVVMFVAAITGNAPNAYRAEAERWSLDTTASAPVFASTDNRRSAAL